MKILLFESEASYGKTGCYESKCKRPIPIENIAFEERDVTCKQCLVRIGIVRDCDMCASFRRISKTVWNYCGACGKKIR